MSEWRFYAGLALLLDFVWPLVFLPVVLLAIDRRVIPREERHLESEFGKEYFDYRGHVRKWL